MKHFVEVIKPAHFCCLTMGYTLELDEAKNGNYKKKSKVFFYKIRGMLMQCTNYKSF